MRVLLAPGEYLIVGLEAGDGAFTIAYDRGGSGHLTVLADMPDSSGREGLIYDEDFSSHIVTDAVTTPFAVSPD